MSRLNRLPLNDLALSAAFILTGAWYLTFSDTTTGVFALMIAIGHLVSSDRRARLIAVTAERDRLRKQATEPRCESTTRGVLKGDNRFWFCRHPVRHDGLHEADDGMKWLNLQGDPEHRIANALAVAKSWREGTRYYATDDTHKQVAGSLVGHVIASITAALKGWETTLADGTTIPATTQEQR